MVFDRAAIFRSTHENARREIRCAGFKGTYRQAVSIALCAVYYAEHLAAEERAYMATLPPVPPEIEERASQLRAQAWGCRIDGPGNEMSSALHLQARTLIDTARGLAA